MIKPRLHSNEHTKKRITLLAEIIFFKLPNTTRSIFHITNQHNTLATTS